MTSYFQYNDNKTKKPPARTEHGTEIVEIDGMLVTEGAAADFANLVREGREVSKKATDRGQTHISFGAFDNPAYDRHGWRCPCIKCRIDRGEE